MSMQPIIFKVALFRGDFDQARSQYSLLWLMEALVRINQSHIRQFKHLAKDKEVPAPYPMLYRAGVHYEPEPGTEEWLDIPNVLAVNGGTFPGPWADCEDLACWRTAELREQDRPVKAKPFAKWRLKPDGSYAYHALVLLRTGASKIRAWCSAWATSRIRAPAHGRALQGRLTHPRRALRQDPRRRRRRSEQARQRFEGHQGRAEENGISPASGRADHRDGGGENADAGRDASNICRIRTFQQPATRTAPSTPTSRATASTVSTEIQRPGATIGAASTSTTCTASSTNRTA